MIKLIFFITLVIFALSEEKIGDVQPPKTLEKLESLDFPELEAILWKRGQKCNVNLII